MLKFVALLLMVDNALKYFRVNDRAIIEVIRSNRATARAFYSLTLAERHRLLDLIKQGGDAIPDALRIVKKERRSNVKSTKE